VGGRLLRKHVLQEWRVLQALLGSRHQPRCRNPRLRVGECQQLGEERRLVRLGKVGLAEEEVVAVVVALPQRPAADP
jgi:hypothetical protein